jgi:hypothetical protein
MDHRDSAIPLLVASTLICAGVWLIARWVAAQLALGPRSAGIAAFGAAWIAMYPFARRNTAVPRWTHWVRGAFAVLAIWLFTSLAK